ncbi:serine palmitoyltransferase [Clavulina sp. PMI_390]|nr:serine palmitoyltransferase [Clavulina sp. PMI_390]
MSASSSISASAAAQLQPLFYFLTNSLSKVEETFDSIPGSAVIARYVRSSHQNDPWRTILELILVIFAIRTLLQSRTPADRSGKHFISFSDKEIDDLVDEWQPEPLVKALTPAQQAELASVPVIVGAPGPKPKIQSPGNSNKTMTVTNLAGLNFTGLAGNEEIKERAVNLLREYGLGACGPPGFYGTVDVHQTLERDIASFLGTESAIIYSQDFSTISSVIPAFCKRGDIIIADRGVNFAIHLGIKLSRSTVRWYDHNDMNSLEEVVIGVTKELKKKRAPLTRHFIITEGIFENDGVVSDLPKLVELKKKYKYRLMLDESYSFGTVGRTGRGLTELYNVPADQVDMIVGAMSHSLNATGGFCAGSRVAVEHQRINGTAFVFSASMPIMLAMAASEGIAKLTTTPSILTDLHANIFAIRSVLDKLDCITIPSHPASAIIHIYIRNSSTPSGHLHPEAAAKKRPSNPLQLITREAPPPTPEEIAVEERLLQEVVDEALAQGVLLTRAQRVHGHETVEPRPSIRIAASAALTKKETEKAVAVVKNALVKVLGRR